MNVRTTFVAIASLMTAFVASASAQDAAKVQAQSYRVVLENNKVRVLRFISKPGMGVCGVGIHSHPGHVTVMLTSAKVRVIQGGKTTMTEVKAGDAFWEPPVTHEVENYGGSEVRSLIIEVKDAPR